MKTPHEKSRHVKTGETSEKQSVDPNDPDSRFDGTTSGTNVYKRATPGETVRVIKRVIKEQGRDKCQTGSRKP